MNKSWHVHYQNKYPGGYCEESETSFKVYNGEGKLVVCMSKGGDGMWHDRSEEMGLSGKHDLSPIPKDSRVHKVVGGKIGKDDLADEREELRNEFEREGRIPSCEELEKEGYRFDEKQRVTKRPDASDEAEASEEGEAEAAAPAKKKGSKKKAK